jgi:hypothetical protein
MVAPMSSVCEFTGAKTHVGFEDDALDVKYPLRSSAPFATEI